MPAPPRWEAQSLALVVGSDVAAENTANGVFEELTTFDYWPDAEQQQFYFNGVSRQVWLGPVGTPEEEAAKQEALNSMLTQSGMMGMEEEGGGVVMAAYSYSSNELWLEITGVTNEVAYLTLHNTEPEVMYELRSREVLSDTNWLTEEYVIGADEQDWTPTTIATLGRTNLFVSALSWRDGDGDGLPDWWELENGLDPDNPDTGDTGVSDGYKDGDGDGWTNLQEYENGTSPSGFDTPPAPQGISISLGTGGTSATIRWQPANGPVTGYTIERSFTNEVIQVGSGTTEVADTSSAIPSGFYFYEPQFRVQAHYSGGSSAWSGWISAPESLAPEARIFFGGLSQAFVLVADVPPTAGTLRVGRWDANTEYYSVTNWDFALSTISNGLVALPEDVSSELLAGGYPARYVQWIGDNAAASAASNQGGSAQADFFDGREQLKQNLIFLLRAANRDFSFQYLKEDPFYSPYWVVQPTDYVHAGLYDLVHGAVPNAYLNEFRPFEENYEYRNFVFDSTNVNEYGYLQTGVDIDVSGFPYLYYPPQYFFTPPSGPASIPSVLSASDAQWTYFDPMNTSWDMSTIGISPTGSEWVMTGNARNLYGLPYLSAKLAYHDYNTMDVAFLTLQAGGSIPGYNPGVFYPEAALPQFQTVDYYFCQPRREWPSPYEHPADPFPGHIAFSPTNEPPLMIVGVGDPYFKVGGYAKLAIVNGYTNKFGYLGQYFDHALLIDTYGVVTTNETGILSPYGEFFPTEPGPTALVTMPDLDTGERGTGVVHVIKLQLDVNHDGVMDTSFTGPDNTSADRPFVFWVNNDHDTISGKDLNTPTVRNHDNDSDGRGARLGGFRALVAGRAAAAPWLERL